ncbi:hypothetical protein CGRA01v4_05844 [Colletotrichum graminicola]|nr:hypothetical protein CGRA01v4_05844 [Colletotrichum graminicola]
MFLSDVATAYRWSTRLGVDCIAPLDWNSSALPVGNVEISGPIRLLGTAGWKVGKSNLPVNVRTYHDPVSWLL